jgi:long-chain acyl-CoA synthetase
MKPRIWHRAHEPGIPVDMSFESLPVPEFLRRSARMFPRQTALVFENCRMTYAELDSLVDRVATALAALGVHRGSRVAIQLPNLPQTVYCYYGALRAGAQVVLTNPIYVEREIEHQWNDANIEIAIVGDWLFASKIAGIRHKLPVREYLVTGVADHLGFPLNLLAPAKLRKQGMSADVTEGPGVRQLMRLLRHTKARPSPVALDLDDVALLQYTGGTTGFSKGAMLTHRNLSFNVQQVNQWFATLERGRETYLCCLPFFHVFGMTVSLNWPVFLGARMVLVPNPREVQKLVSNIVHHRVTIFPAVPAMFNMILNHPGIENLDLTSVKGCFSGSAPLAEDVLERFEAMTGGRIVEGFGLTETSPVTHCNPVRGKRKIGSIGVPLPGTDARIVDLETGLRDLPTGEAGELLISGPQCMRGYWNRPEETDAMLRDGWIHTGDIATMDEEGYFRIAGRKKDLIIVSGYNVYPDEIDRVLAAHPKVLESATIGVPDSRCGESVKSFVVLKPGETATSKEVREYCQQELAAYKVPRAVEFVAELPKSAIGKALRKELRVAEEKREQT